MGDVRGLALVFGLQMVAFGPLAVLRTVDADEGFYMLAARLVMQGRLPYVDFLYTQMPLLPYVYGVWMRVFGFNWYSARVLSAILAALLGVLIYVWALRAFRRRAMAWLGVGLYVASAFALAFNTVVMTYALSTLLLFAAFALVEPRRDHLSAGRVLASGLLVGLAIETRLPMAAAAPAFVFGLLTTRSASTRVAQWLVGLVVGLLPALVFLAVDQQAFVFGNLGFHTFRNGVGLVANWAQKGAIVAELLNIRSAGGEAITFQVPLLLALNLYALALLVKRRVPGTIAFLVTPLLGVALLLPTPTYSQYFVVLLPFVIVTALYAIDCIWRDVELASARAVAGHLRIAGAAFLAVYALIVPLVFYRYVSWLGPSVPGLQQINPRDWSLPAIRNVSGEIDRLSQPGQEVLAVWPGYLVETHAAAVPGMENHGWMEVSGHGPADNRPPVASTPSVQSAIAQHEPELIVLGILTPGTMRDMALGNGYAVVDDVASVDVLERP